jgi:hypothetical protein
MAFFTHLGNVWYTFPDGSTTLINDITAYANITDEWKKDARVQIPYEIRDGELPHMISYRLYGTVDYWWTILMMNNIYDFDNQWPRNPSQLNDYIERKYPGKNLTDVHHYINPNGLIADLLSLRIELDLTVDDDVIDQAELETVSIEEFEIGLNESKRKIILIDPDYIASVQTQFETAMNPET